MAWMLEELSLNAWPSLQSVLYDGWLLRFAGGYTRRANSVQALAAGAAPVEEKVAWCEAQYRAQGLPTIFKITPCTQPAALDAVLEARGYRREAETDVLSAPASALHAAACGPDITIMSREAWLGACAQFNRKGADAHRHHQAIVQAIVPPVCPVVAWSQGRPMAMGLGVLERGTVGIYDLVTDAAHRRQGHATRIISTIFAWAAAHGAQGAYLNVLAENAPAQALYATLGFRPSYRYWYRVG